MSKVIFKGHDEKKQVVEGIKNSADIITTTYGGQGGVVMYQPLNGPATFTKDGFEVSRQIQFPSLLENIGAKFVQEACEKIAFKVGDGTTTMAAMLGAFAEETFKYELAGTFNREISIGIKFAIDKCLEILQDIVNKIEKNDYASIKSVALVSSNQDEQVASFITEAYQNINKHMTNINPVILIEESKNERSSINIVEGMQLQRGILSPQFFKKDEKNKMRIEFNDHPYIIIFGKSIARPDIQQLLHAFDEIIKKGKSCLIIASDFSDEVINFLLINRHNGSANFVAVKTPGFGDGQVAIAQDIATRTGAKVLCENGDFLPENINLQDFAGVADKVCVERDTTIIVGGQGNKDEIKLKCDALQEEVLSHKSKGSSYHVEQTTQRIQSLNGVVCVIKLGGINEMSITETKHRVEDAVHATKHALQSGVVIGGGVDTLYIALKLEEFVNKNSSHLTKAQKIGIDIMIKVCKTPFYKLTRSCGLSGGVCADKVISEYVKSGKLESGVDVRTGELSNFIKSGILNPEAVTRGILLLLKEVGDLFVMCNVFVAEDPKDDKYLKEGFNHLS